MSHIYNHIWKRLPEPLKEKLVDDPDAELTSADLMHLERAGIPTISLEGMELEKGVDVPHLSGPFRDWVAGQTKD